MISASTRVRILSAALTMAATLPQPSLALEKGGGVGNGGNARVCFDDPRIAEALAPAQGVVSRTIPTQYLPHITSIEALDLFFAQRRKGVHGTAPAIEQLAPGENPANYATRLAEAWASFSVPAGPGQFISLSKILKQGQATISRVDISYDAGVFPADDVRPLIQASDGCVYATIAIQRSIGGNERELAIDGRLFYLKNKHTSHSPLSQAVLLMHEDYLAAHLSIPSGVYDPSERLRTDGVIEFVSTFIQKDSTADELGRVIRRRDLFGARPIEGVTVSGNVQSPALQQMLREFRDAWKLELHSQMLELSPRAYSQIESRYESLPYKYRKHVNLSRTNVLNETVPYKASWQVGDRWGITWKDFALRGRDSDTVTSINASLEKFRSTVVVPAARSRLLAKASERRARLDDELSRLAATNIVAPTLISHLRDAFAEVVRTGWAEKILVENDFLRMQSSEELIEVSLQPRFLKATP